MTPGSEVRRPLVRFQPPELFRGVRRIPQPGLIRRVRTATQARPQYEEVEGIRPDEEPVSKTGGGMVRLGVRVPRLPLNRVRPWCNWQHDWFQPGWSGFESLGTCLERESQDANLPYAIGLIVQQEDAGVACRLVSVQARVRPRQSTKGPVAQRRGQLPYKETIGGSSPPRTTWRRRKEEGGDGE